MRRNSGIIGPIQNTSTTAASGVYDLFDNYNGEIDDKWPQFQVDSVSNSNGTALNEETNNTITVTTSGVPDSTTLYYSIATVSGTTLTSADFTNGDVTGNFTVTSNSGSFILSPAGDDLSESNVVKVQIRRGSTSGDILAESENLTIADAAAPSGAPEFDWRYYAYGANMENTYVYWIQTDGTQSLLRQVSGQQHSNSTQTWNSYSEDLSSYSGTTGRIYIGYRTGSGYKNDPQFDNMELIDTTSGDISLDPGSQTGRNRWQKITSYTTTLFAPTTSTFSTISISPGSPTTHVWNYDAGGTPSSATGSTKDANGSTSGYYLYFEGSNPNNSSSNRYYWVRMTSDYTLY